MMETRVSTVRLLALHALISLPIASALTAYHFYRMFHAKGEDVYGYVLLSLLVEWPLGNLLGGIVSIRILKPGISLGGFILSAMAAGTVAYFAAFAMCSSIKMEPLNWIVGAAFLPITSCLIVYFGSRKD